MYCYNTLYNKNIIASTEIALMFVILTKLVYWNGHHFFYSNDDLYVLPHIICRYTAFLSDITKSSKKGTLMSVI